MSLLLLLRNHGVLEAVEAEGEWTQATAEWDAVAVQTIIASATFEQVQEWEAAASEAFIATGTWVQTATWDATGDVDNPVVPVDAEGAWTQAAASWAAVGIGGPDPIIFTPSSGRVFPAERDFIEGQASFSQRPASWHAVMDVNDDEPLLLSDLLELVA
jgi:hypothetical protein